MTTTVETTTPQRTFESLSDFLLTAEVGDTHTETDKGMIVTRTVLEVGPGDREGERGVHPETGEPLRERMLTCKSMTTRHHGRDTLYGRPYSYTSVWDTADRVGAYEVRGATDPERVYVMHSHLVTVAGRTRRCVAVVPDVKRRSAKGLLAAHEAALAAHEAASGASV